METDENTGNKRRFLGVLWQRGKSYAHPTGVAVVTGVPFIMIIINKRYPFYCYKTVLISRPVSAVTQVAICNTYSTVQCISVTQRNCCVLCALQNLAYSVKTYFCTSSQRGVTHLHASFFLSLTYIYIFF